MANEIKKNNNQKDKKQEKDIKKTNNNKSKNSSSTKSSSKPKSKNNSKTNVNNKLKEIKENTNNLEENEIKDEPLKELEENKNIEEVNDEEIPKDNEDSLEISKEAVNEEKADIDLEPKNKKLFKDTFSKNLILVTFFTFFIEILFRIVAKIEIFSYATLRILISTFILSFIITFLSSITKHKWFRTTINLIYIFAYAIYSWLQIGFINYLGVYISFHTSSQFGAVKDYIGDFLASFKPIYYIVLVPFIIALITYIIINKKGEYNKLNKKSLLWIPLFIISIGLYYLTLTVPFMQNDLQLKSNKELFKDPSVPTIAVNQFGTVTFGILDFKSFIFPVEEDEELFISNNKNNTETISNRKVSKALEYIANNETNSKYKNLNNYFLSQKVTDYNEYTGMFEGKNVVVILMESVNEAIINEEYFPNFYNLYSNGWHWENNYSPRNSCATGNNEFSAMTSLYSIYNTCTSNTYKNNTYFNAIFNLFNNKGYRTNSMHNFVEWYYYRSTIHPNMGSMKYYGAKDLDIKTAGYYGEWPSDEEFFKKAFDIILNDPSDKPFMTWLTTVTSHQPYSNSSTYGDLYKDYFKEFGYSNSVSRYLSKLKVVDNAIGLMVEKLKAAGKFDDTVIVLLADHYPYGLKKSYVSEMIKHDLDDYDIEKTPFVIYNSSMKGKTFAKYNSYINLLPTLANLMNLDYDPRLFMGEDILSNDYESLVVFADGSWKNENAYYNASNSSIKYYKDVTYTAEEIQNINNKVGLKISMSSSAIKNNYFKYLGEKIEEYNKNNPEVQTSKENIEDPLNLGTPTNININ